MADKTLADYKIGEELFRYVEGGGIFRYKVDGVRQYQGETQLEVEAQNCSHGWKCRLLIARDDYGKIHAVHMLNEDDEDHQRHWHGNEGFHFWPSSAKAKAEGVKAMIRRAKERVEKAKGELAAAQSRLTELETLLGTTKDPQ